MSDKVKPYVIIVGAGPAGLLLSLLLGNAGIPVRLLDAGDKLDDRPRATHYAPESVAVLERAGVLEDVRARGFLPNGVCWRRLGGDVIARITQTSDRNTPHRDQMVCLPLNQLGQILLSHVESVSTIEVCWSYKVVGIGQNSEQAWVHVESPEGPQTISASYVVGCDGANSQVRRSLFGDREFPGSTWKEQVIATNSYYPFQDYGYMDSNFIIDGEHWHMAARITVDGLWRVTYGEIPGLTEEEYRKRQPLKFQTMLPGHPTPEKWRTVAFSPYSVHQRLAKSMRCGRFLLAADAAHLCNPFGGLGLTGGIVDVDGLFDCLNGLWLGLAEESILDRYSEIRRGIYTDVVDPISTSNMRRMFHGDLHTLPESDPFLKMVVDGERDPIVARKLREGMNMLSHDFTQYYSAAADQPSAEKLRSEV